MTFIKANLDVLICGLVALLALGFCFWPVGAWKKDTLDEMQARYAQVQSANHLVLPSVEIIPGGPKIPNATPEDNVIDAKKAALEQVNRYSKRVEEMAAEQNWAHRVIKEKATGKNPGEVPLLGGKPLPDFLPKITGKAFAFDFKHPYSEQFAIWTAKLAGGSGPAVPPKAEDVLALVTEAETARTNAAQATNAVMGVAGAGGAGQLSAKEKNEIQKKAVYERASRIHCYVDEQALQRRELGGNEGAPNEAQIFEAFVDSWLLQDVVNAVSDLNTAELKKYPGEEDVGHSPVKRLERVVIGNSALGNAAGLFFGAVAASPAGTVAAAVNNADASRTVTGHVSGDAYDVVLMRITMDLDPAFENQFIDSLYRQNNGYTVLNISTRAVDPLEAAGNGFMYGPTQVVRLDILVEELMFRSWTVHLMPDEIKKSLNIAWAGASPVDALASAGGSASGMAFSK